MGLFIIAEHSINPSKANSNRIISNSLFLFIIISLFFILIHSTLLYYSTIHFNQRPNAAMGINDIIFYWMILILTLGSVIGMILNRNLLLKFFLCFESFFFIMSIIIIIWSCSSNGIIIILYLLWNSTFEVILGLTMSYLL